MPSTSREIEEIMQRPLKEPRFANFFISLLRPFTKIPVIRTYIANSVGGLSGRLFRCRKENDHEKASKIAIYALERFRNKKSWFYQFMDMDHDNWWQFMVYGVESARWLDNEEIKERFIEYADTGIEPLKGYFVARSYLEISRWKYKLQDYEKAVQYAEIASRADETWAEPDFILGWYSMALNKNDAEEHLSRAIEKDQRILFRIANDEICKQYPHIINKLKEKYSKISLEGRP